VGEWANGRMGETATQAKGKRWGDKPSGMGHMRRISSVPSRPIRYCSTAFVIALSLFRRIAHSPFRPFAHSPLLQAVPLQSIIVHSMPENSAPVARSSTVEDYLEQILDLINTKGYARVADIALGLKISQASVTNMVQRLDSEGLLKYEKYRGLVLTTAGETLARNIMRRHQLLTDFLRMLGIDEDVIYHDVEGMEHHISPQTLHAIEALVSALQEKPELLDRIKHQAHGN
jgi:Mn-dependent DtxR family transcriptional regulator